MVQQIQQPVSQARRGGGGPNPLDLLYTAKPNSGLASYMTSGGRSLPATLRTILNTLKDLIKEKKNYDPRNPEMIMCSQQLENIFGLRALHVSQVRAALNSFLVAVPPGTGANPIRPLFTRPGRNNIKSESSGNPPIEVPIAAATVKKESEIPAGGRLGSRFRLTPVFLRHVMPAGSDPGQAYTFQEAAEALSRYILARKDHLIDFRNIKVAIIKDDPLGEVLGVQAFHRCQTAYLLRRHLMPLTPTTTLERTKTTSEERVMAGEKRSCGVQCAEAEQQEPVTAAKKFKPADVKSY